MKGMSKLKRDLVSSSPLSTKKVGVQVWDAS
jgi:hypothetical protein